MTDEIEWGPTIYAPEGGWPEGKCPIPWAKAGEFEVFYGQNEHRRHAPHYPAYFYDWSNITAYRVRADLTSRLSPPAAPDVAEKMADALASVTGAFKVIADEIDMDLEETAITASARGTGEKIRITMAQVIANAEAALAAYAASKEAGR